MRFLHYWIHDLQVVFSSAEEVENFQPQSDEIIKCPGRSLLITAVAPPESRFDFYSRFFCPKLGIKEVTCLSYKTVFFETPSMLNDII